MSFGNFKAPKNCSKYHWTRHSVGKMMQYGLSAQRVIRVIRSFSRKEEGIAKNTVAVMQPLSVKIDKDGKKKWSQEIWVMYQTRKDSVSKEVQNSKIKNEKKEENILEIKPDLLKINQLKIISVWRYPGVSPKNNPVPSDILDELGDLL